MKVADIMTRHVEFIEPDATVQETVVLMGELDVSALPLGTPTDIKGVVTDRDVLYRAVAEGKDPRRTRVSEIATRLVFTCRPDDPLTTAMDLMASHNIRRLPVVEDGGGVIGWLSLSDVSRLLLVESEVVQRGLKDLTDRLEVDDEAAGTGTPA
ncbi:CBS domain-containing protein [Indioceanicola profundi]|uniref:CBS domain-containing protein n=1 Tax=Indioceanicola profundi TaxID=2220096 RepID=UPI001CEDF0AD|nr:CBS domain-containing protein [Indioceanicola profundi]